MTQAEEEEKDLSEGSLIEEAQPGEAQEADSEMDDSIEMEDPIASMAPTDHGFSLHHSLRMVQVVSMVMQHKYVHVKNKTVSFLELAFADLKFVAEVVSMRVKKYRRFDKLVDRMEEIATGKWEVGTGYTQGNQQQAGTENQPSGTPV